MKRKSIFRMMAVAAIATMSMSACQNNDKIDAKTPGAAATDGFRVAYVEIDSVLTQYEYSKEMKVQLEKKGQNIEAALKAQEQNLTAAAQNFQNKLNNNGFSSRQEAESQQAAIQRQQEQYVASQQRLTGEFQTETAKFQKALLDSINNFLAQYNKDKKYAFILTKQAGDNILYADKSYDITDDVVKGLNKAYKPGKSEAKTEAKAEAKADSTAKK